MAHITAGDATKLPPPLPTIEHAVPHRRLMPTWALALTIFVAPFVLGIATQATGEKTLLWVVFISIPIIIGIIAQQKKGRTGAAWSLIQAEFPVNQCHRNANHFAMAGQIISAIAIGEPTFRNGTTTRRKIRRSAPISWNDRSVTAFAPMVVMGCCSLITTS